MAFAEAVWASVRHHDHQLRRIRSPIEAKSFKQRGGYCFRCVATPICRLSIDIGLHLFQAARKRVNLCHILLTYRVIPIGDQAEPDVLPEKRFAE